MVGHSGCSMTKGTRTGVAASSSSVPLIRRTLPPIRNAIASGYCSRLPTSLLGGRGVPGRETPPSYAGFMVLGVVIGFAAGTALGLVWHVLRHSHLESEARTAEARLTDA